jgi:hypothetical protein
MPEKEQGPLAWITVQLIAPAEAISFAAFVDAPPAKDPIRVVPVAYVALQHLRYEVEGEAVGKGEEAPEPIEEVESRIVPLVIDAAGVVIELDDTTPGFVGLGEDAVAAKRIATNYAEQVKTALAAAAASTTPTAGEKGSA